MRATGKFVAALVVWLAGSGGAVGADQIWVRAPTPGELLAAFPRDGDRLVEGVAQLRCAVGPDRKLADCAVVSEAPAGVGVGAAALSLAPNFEVAAAAAHKLAGRSVTFPIRFQEGPPAPPARQAKFQTSRAYQGLGDAGPYYPERAARGRVTGVVVMDCRVLPQGELKACEVVQVSPGDYGFDFAAVRMAEREWMTAGEPAVPGTPEPADGVWRFRVEFSGRRSAP
jgi:TonB family protein